MPIVRKILFVFNLITLIPVFIAALGPYVSIEAWWLPGILACGMPWLLLIPLFWIVFWAFSNLKNIIANVIVLGANFQVIQQSFQLSFSYPLPSNKDITILSFNVRGFEYKYSQFVAIRNYIKDKNPDIICLQEFRNQIGENKGLLIKLKKYLNIKNHFFLEKYPQSNFGLLILSRYPIERAGAVPYKGEEGKNALCFVDLRLYGQTLRVYNVHFQSYPFSASQRALFEERQGKKSSRKPQKISLWNPRQAWKLITTVLATWRIHLAQLESLNKHRNNCKNALVICGDFNTPPYTYLYREARRNLQDSFITRGIGFGKTYGRGLTSFRIDYILVSLNFRVINFGTLATRHLSDHSAVISRIRFNFHN
ncbi:MAG: endonuclease/exonuclease/phosphatase family protein [Bacteroidia bacterium]|nr:endonuclease/exonuclease/phosphatase family protein [Bacteroidia bacterium]MDW8157733.1 endonuclease/exonuclease/phosphatase family protein [Bacteroidia bacterium]